MTEYRVETVEMGSGFKSKDPREVIEGVLTEAAEEGWRLVSTCMEGRSLLAGWTMYMFFERSKAHQTPKVVFEALPSCTTRRRHRSDRLRQSAADRAPSEESHRRQAPRAAQLLASPMALI